MKPIEYSWDHGEWVSVINRPMIPSRRIKAEKKCLDCGKMNPCCSKLKCQHCDN